MGKPKNDFVEGPCDSCHKTVDECEAQIKSHSVICCPACNHALIVLDTGEKALDVQSRAHAGQGPDTLTAHAYEVTRFGECRSCAAAVREGRV